MRLLPATLANFLCNPIVHGGHRAQSVFLRRSIEPRMSLQTGSRSLPAGNVTMLNYGYT